MAEKSGFFSSHPTSTSKSSRGRTTGDQRSQNGEASSTASSPSQRPLAKRRCARESKADTCGETDPKLRAPAHSVIMNWSIVLLDCDIHGFVIW